MKLRIAIAGAGPAGTSLAIRLARRDFEVTLIERETFPRHKLCGEFISPECLSHFEDLGVLDEMLSAGGSRIAETRFYEPAGRSFAVSSKDFLGRGFALSLSRAEMDMRLLNHARAAGVTVHEDTAVNAVSIDKERIVEMAARRGNGDKLRIPADLFVDATGRARVLSKLISKTTPGRERPAIPNRSLFVGFKTHLIGAQTAGGTCEIYLFPGGYGGLSPIENGLTNHCFLIRSSIARQYGGDAGAIVKNVIYRNKRAAGTLANAEPVADWLAVSIDSFGRSERGAASNLLSVGDSAAFVDPFTGSGMLMAFESAALLAVAIVSRQTLPDAIGDAYHAEYERKFSGRLRFCSALRRAAFLPFIPPMAISLLNLSSRSRVFLAHSTRSSKFKWPKIH